MLRMYPYYINYMKSEIVRLEKESYSSIVMNVHFLHEFLEQKKDAIYIGTRSLFVPTEAVMYFAYCDYQNDA